MRKNSYKRTAYFRERDSTIELTGKINSYNVKDFSSALDKFNETKDNHLTVDFSKVELAYPSGVLPIISSLHQLRKEGSSVYIKLPQKDDTRKFFRNVNWAHYLSPKQFEKSESTYDRHLVTRMFSDPNQQKKVVDDFMDVVLRSMSVPRDIISGLEWSINEITDNVLNHSNSEFGGIIQASTYPRHRTIAFAVADGGRGILSSMQEGYPSLRTDLQAIGEAIKEGVTRNPKFGQGNGLAGTLRVTTMTGGSFDIISGAGRFIATPNETKRQPFNHANYQGTIVSGQIKIKKDFSIADALTFGNSHKYVPSDIIETQYEMDDRDCLFLKMRDESTGFGTRKSGFQIRNKIMNLMTAQPTYPIIVDWEGIPVISSSFADEVMGKLFIKLGPLTFSARVRNTKMEPLISGLLDKAISQRLSQTND